MPSTIRVSDELYEVIDDYRRKDETFQDVIERMAHEIGLLPSRIKDVDHLRRKLEKVHGFEPDEVDSVFDAFRTVYIGQEREAMIGIPHEDVEPEYPDELDTLKRLGMIEEHHYTGKYDYGYRTTAIGARIGSELIRDHIREREHEVNSVLEDFTNIEVALFINAGFGRSDTGHLTTRNGNLATDYREAILDSETAERRFGTFLERLTEIGLLVRHSEDTFAVAPPEFDDYLCTEATELQPALKQVEVYEAIRTYLEDDIDTRDGLLDELHAANEEDLETIVASLHEDGLTSRYTGQDDAPLLVKDQEGLFQRIRSDLREEIKADDGAML